MTIHSPDLAAAVRKAKANSVDISDHGSTNQSETKIADSDPTWPVVDDAAYYGLAGQLA
jgi:hypothetical protein